MRSLLALLSACALLVVAMNASESAVAPASDAEALSKDERFLQIASLCVRKDDVFAVQNGYDLAAQVGNPGQLLLANSIRLAHESGARRYVTGNRDYLRHWSEHTLDTVRLRIRRPSAISAARLALYDVIHHHRQSDALRAADETKDRRKRSVRSSGAATEAEDI